MSLEQQQCYRNKTPNEDELEEQQKNVAINKLLAEVENRHNSYETSYEDEEDHSSLGDPALTGGEDGIDGWNKENKQLEDPVGDMITDRLNEGSIPYFGYQNYVRQRKQQQQGDLSEEDTSFDWTHILCVRNFRALRKMMLGAWETNHNNRLDGHSSMRFLQEIFLVVLVSAYAISDVAVRATSWLLMLAFMFVVHALIDVDEMRHGLVELLGSKHVERFTNGMNQCRTYWKRIMKTIHTDFLWGDYFQGRTIVWSEEERLPKFRRKHITLIRINRERKQNAKTTRRLERDIKRSRRKGLIGDGAEAVIVNEAKVLLQTRKIELDATAKELNQKPPTYFPTSVRLQEEEEGERASIKNLSRSDATNGHLGALRFCHKMVFLREQEAQQAKQENVSTIDVSITHTTSDSVDHIEVVSKGVDKTPYPEESDDDSTACSDFPSIGEHWNCDSDEDDSISYADSASTSEQALPWIAVGAKIGEKLLKSRKLHRVVAHPDELQKSLPNEAKKLIQGMDISDEANEIAFDLLIEKSKSAELKKKLEKERDLKQEMELLKRPVHGMWSPPGTTPPVKARPQMGGTPSRFAVIEMPTSFNDTSFEPPSPPAKLQNGLLMQPSIDRQPQQLNRLTLIEKGVRIIVPLFSPDPNISSSVKSSSFYQMGTVVSSRRCFVQSNQPSNMIGNERTNCLVIKVILDKCILRGCRFAEMNLRIMDEWNYTPCHSKFPIGSCVATTFGVGVLVGWRVEDDMHIIRSLWNRSGPGSAVAYFRRDSIHSVVQAAVGFDVETTYGSGKVVGYVRGGKQNITGKYHIRMDHETRFKGRMLNRNRVVEFSRFQILSCRGAIFVPVTEHIRAAALYQLELLHYKARLREQTLKVGGARKKGTWRNFSEYVDLFAVSFSKAIAEEPEFDREYNKFISHIITFLEGGEGSADSNSSSAQQDEMKESVDSSATSDPVVPEDQVTWSLQDIFKCIWTEDVTKVDMFAEEKEIMSQIQAFEEAHDSAMILIRVLMRTTAVARASVSNRPKLNMALSMILEGLILIRQLLRIHKKHTSSDLVQAWFRTLHGISTTFGPLRQRTAALWDKILEKLHRHGTVAKRRLLRFVDICLGDTLLLPALELGDWKTALLRFEAAIVKSEIADKKTCEQLRKGIKILYQNIAPRKKDKHTRAAAARSGQKAMTLAKLFKIVATPGRSILKLLTKDDVLDMFDRVLVRVFEKDPVCSMMINIFANHFYSIRHLRYLNNMAITGKLWETVLDAVDEELSFATAEFPEQTQEFLKPFVKLFSLGVSQFHSIQSGAVSGDWLDFLLEDESVKLIQELDGRFIDFLESLCRDVKTIFEVMPYIKTIDHDILNLMDEFDPDTLLRELSDSIGDSDKFIQYVKERTSVLIERFLEYLPKMSIPIERRELEGGWVLTCRGKQGGDLCLSDISMDRENVLCYVLGGDENVLQPLANTLPRATLDTSFDTANTDVSVDGSILDEVRELIVSAQQYNNWVVGVNGIKHPSQFHGIPKPLDDLPMSDTLKAGIDLWQSSAISDFELLEIAIRDVSYQISHTSDSRNGGAQSVYQQPSRQPSPNVFNPKEDPTVLFLDIKNLTMNLNEFTFRVEKKEPTIFDPVFEGGGSIMVKNLSLALKVEIKKERVKKNGVELYRPVFHLTTLDVGLEKLKIVFTETGADWLLNSVLKGFRRQTSEIVEAILKEQITQQVHSLLENANGFVDANPDLLLVALGITLRDLGESIVSV